MTETVANRPSVAASRRPTRSWVNALTAGIDRLPVPRATVYVAVMVFSVVLSNSQNWLAGLAPLGTFTANQVYYGLLTPGVLWLLHALDNIARNSLDTFAPALDIEAGELDSLRDRLTMIPARPAWVILGIAAVMTMAEYASQPELEGIVGLPPAVLAVRGVVETVSVALIFVLLYHTIRQLRLVAWLHERAAHVNLFEPAPLYAFSRLTSRTAIGTVLLIVPSALVLPAGVSQTDLATVAVWLVGIVAIASAAFVLPLMGMHRRIASEKDALEGATGRRLAATMVRLHDAVDRDDLSRAEALNRALEGLVRERDIVGRLSTWPWHTGTLAAFLSAVALPLALWLVTRFLERVV